MTGRDLFGVIVRTFGIMFCLWGIYTVAYGAVRLEGIQLGQKFPVMTDLIFGSVEIVIGFVVLLASNFVVWLTYGAKPIDKKSN